MAKETNNVIEMIEPAPDCLKISRENWAKTPDVVRAEIIRAHGELTAGIERYRPASERDATMQEFHEMAAQSGKSLRNVIREFAGIEQLLRKDLVGGLQVIAKRSGFDLHDVMARVLEREPDAAA